MLSLKLLVYQQNDGMVPSQMRLYLDGNELTDGEATLADAGIVPNATVQLFIDKTLEADLQGAFDAHEQQTTKKRGRATEDGFVGSALISTPFTPKAAEEAAKE